MSDPNIKALNLFTAKLMTFSSDCIKAVKTDGVYFPRKGKSGHFWRPTIEIEQAIMVLEKCRKHCVNIGDYWSVIIDSGPSEFHVYLKNSKDGDCRYVASCDNIAELPLAICLFAKKLFSGRAKG